MFKGRGAFRSYVPGFRPHLTVFRWRKRPAPEMSVCTWLVLNPTPSPQVSSVSGRRCGGRKVDTPSGPVFVLVTRECFIAYAYDRSGEAKLEVEHQESSQLPEQLRIYAARASMAIRPSSVTWHWP